MRPIACLIAASVLLPVALADADYAFAGHVTLTCHAWAAGTAVLCGASACVPAPHKDGTYRFRLSWDPVARQYETLRLNVTTYPDWGDVGVSEANEDVTVTGASPLLVTLPAHASDGHLCFSAFPGSTVSVDPMTPDQEGAYRVTL